MSEIFALYAVQWMESERGWGIRPDGYSFHRSESEANSFVKEMNDNLPDEVPDEYSYANGMKLTVVSKSLYDYVMNNGSIKLYKNNLDDYKNFDASKIGA